MRIPFVYVHFFLYLCAMKSQSLNYQILRLAIPSILANITIPLVGLVDTAIVGHISNATAIGGIAIGTMLFDLLYWNFGFLRVGTSGMTAQAFGRGDRVECARLFSQSIGIALIGAILIWLIQWLFVNLVLMLVPCSPEVASFAREYFFIRVWAAPATLSLMAFKGWFIGMQDTISPMVTDIVVNVVNMVVSYVLAVYTPMGALGVALGTVVAQFTGLTMAAIILVAKRMQQRIHLHGKIPQYIGNLLIMSFAAQIGTLPLTLYYFGQTCNYFAITNLIVIPAAFVLLVLGIGALAFSWCTIGYWLADVAQVFTYHLRLFVEWIESLPCSTTSIHLSAPSILLCYSTVCCAIMMMRGDKVHWWWLLGVIGCLIGIILIELVSII